MDDAPWMCACYVCQMPSSFLDIETVCCGFWLVSAVLQHSSLLLILPFPSMSPILLVLLQQTKRNALLLSLFAPQGDEKSLAVALCWPVLLVQSHSAFSCIDHFYVCVSLCFTSLCFVEWFVLTVLPWPATMVTLSSLVHCTHTHKHTHNASAGLSPSRIAVLVDKKPRGYKKGIIRELANQ